MGFPRIVSRNNKIYSKLGEFCVSGKAGTNIFCIVCYTCQEELQNQDKFWKHIQDEHNFTPASKPEEDELLERINESEELATPDVVARKKAAASSAHKRPAEDLEFIPESHNIEVCSVDFDVKLEPQLGLEYPFDQNTSDEEEEMITPTIDKIKPSSEFASNMEHVENSNARPKNNSDKLKAMDQFILKEISNINVKLDALIETKKVSRKLTSRFPLRNAEEMAEFENSLNESNTDAHIETLRQVIRNEVLAKSLTNILSDDIIFRYNYNGKQNKLALNTYPKLLDIIFRAYPQYDAFPQFVADLRDALKRIKNKYHKASCLAKKQLKMKSSEKASN